MSKLFNLNLSDAVKGLVIAVLTTVLTGLLKVFETGTLPSTSDLQQIGVIAITAGISYLLKNVFTNSDGKLLSSEKPNDTN